MIKEAVQPIYSELWIVKQRSKEIVVKFYGFLSLYQAIQEKEALYKKRNIYTFKENPKVIDQKILDYHWDYHCKWLPLSHPKILPDQASRKEYHQCSVYPKENYTIQPCIIHPKEKNIFRICTSCTCILKTRISSNSVSIVSSTSSWSSDGGKS